MIPSVHTDARNADQPARNASNAPVNRAIELRAGQPNSSARPAIAPAVTNTSPSSCRLTSRGVRAETK